MLYTRKGDDGKTRDFKSGPKNRVSKSSCQTETLGSLDEVNSFLGMAKIKTMNCDWKVGDMSPSLIVGWTQNNLFSIQAEVAGADKRVGKDSVLQMEAWIDEIERALPPIKTFFISGGSEIAVLFDIVRTLTRKAERRMIAGIEEGEFEVASDTLAFINRLSSLFYALARLSNHKSGITEEPPKY